MKHSERVKAIEPKELSVGKAVLERVKVAQPTTMISGVYEMRIYFLRLIKLLNAETISSIKLER
jgi:hypothetical protein